MKNLGCKQIKISINLEIIGEEDKDKKYILFIIKKKSNKISIIWLSHLAQTWLQSPTFII